MNETQIRQTEKFPKLGLPGKLREVQKFRNDFWGETVAFVIYWDRSDPYLDQGC